MKVALFALITRRSLKWRSRWKKGSKTFTPLHRTWSCAALLRRSNSIRERSETAELYRNAAPDGKSIMHAELMLGDSRFLLHDEFPDQGLLSPLVYKGTSITLHLYVSNVDAVFESAIQAGAEVLMPLADQFWGDRYGILRDPFGHKWSVATRIKDLSPKELQTQADEFKAKHSQWPRKA